jgi:hypothetical protein
MAITASRDKVRLRIGDTNSADPLLYDEEIDYFLSERGDDVAKAAADCAAAIAAKYARAFEFETDGQKFKRQQVYEHYTALAKDLRNGVGGGLSTIVVTRVDGVSDDLSTRDGAAQAAATGHVRRGYTNPDELP